MGSRELLKDFLLDFPTRLAKFEQNAIETGLDIQVSLTEIHIIDRIGPEGSQKMNIVAKKLGVTQATLTVACDRLESKGLIERRRHSEAHAVGSCGIQLSSGAHGRSGRRGHIGHDTL